MDQPLLSICIPTHHGRRDVLAQLLESIEVALRGFRGPAIEVCISDNASEDGTQQLVAKAGARHPGLVVYHRQPENVGLTRNLFKVMELASGRYCWLMGSDDLVAPGGLRAVCELLEHEPSATGYVLASVDVDADDPRLRSRQPPRDFHPPGEQRATYSSASDVFEACGNAFTSISWNVVERERWVRLARDHRQRALGHPVWPQVITMGLMTQERPTWVWAPDVVGVHRRNALPFVFERGAATMASKWSELVSGLSVAWADVLGAGSPQWHARMRAIRRIWGGATDARASKLYERPSLKQQMQLTIAWGRAFWNVPGWRREVLPALVEPVWLTRALHATDGRRRSSGLLRRGRDNVRLAAELPARLPAGGARQILVRVHNEGPTTLLASGPHGVGIWHRWSTDERSLTSEELGLNELAEQPLAVSRDVKRSDTLAMWVALLPPREPGRYVLEVSGHQHGLGWLGDAGLGTTLTATVEVR
jgi:Glycosyl transferase family 2